MWGDPEPGPSRGEPRMQGYCGYCSVRYDNLDQHLSSIEHLDAVRSSSRGPADPSSRGPVDPSSRGPAGHTYRGPPGHTYRGPGDPSYRGPPGHTYRGPGDPSSRGPAGHTYRGPGDPSSRGPADHTYRGPAGHTYRGPGDPSSRGPADHTYRGPAGDSSRGPAGHTYRGPGDHTSRGPTDHTYRGPGDHTSRGPADHTSRGPAGHTYRGPADPSSRGNAGHTSRGPADPSSRGPADPSSRGPADPSSRGTPGHTSRGPADPSSRGPADPSSRGTPGHTSRGPTDPSSRGPPGHTSRGPADPSSRGPADPSSRGAAEPPSRNKLSMLERFLKDVMQYHPHRYKDPRPSYADLPAVSTPPLPRSKVDDDGRRPSGPSENLPRSDDAPKDREELGTSSPSGEKTRDPVRGQEELQLQTPPPQTHAPPPVHQKAHRKTDRRKFSGSPSQPAHSTGPGTPWQGLSPGTGPSMEITPSQPAHSTGPTTPFQQGVSSGTGPFMEITPSQPAHSTGPTTPFQQGVSSGTGPSMEITPSQPAHSTGPTTPYRAMRSETETSRQITPWLLWRKKRKETHKEEVFPQTHSDLPVSMETQSKDLESPVQVVTDPPVQVKQVEGRDLSHHTDTQVGLDKVNSNQLDCALSRKRRPSGEEGYWNLPIEEVLPAPEHIPESFRGKTWVQIEKEDEQRVEDLVRQFRQEQFLCYFDTESLARYGRRRLTKQGTEEPEGSDIGSGLLPLMDLDEEDTAPAAVVVRKRKRDRKGTFRLASRCQVVKVSRSTQTVRLVVPTVPAAAPEAPPTTVPATFSAAAPEAPPTVPAAAPEAPPTAVPATSQDTAEWASDANLWDSLPPWYSSIVSPVLPRTSVVYLLCLPTGPAPSSAKVGLPKRFTKKDLQGLKLKYKRLPVSYYEPGPNRILKTAPKSILWRRGSSPYAAPPPHARQLFRSLSTDLNTDQSPGEGPAGVKGQKSADSPLSRVSARAERLRRRNQKSEAPPIAPPTAPPTAPPIASPITERGRSARRTRLSPSKRQTRSQPTPPPPRREGQRRTCSAPLPPSSHCRGGRIGRDSRGGGGSGSC